ncbi:MAG: hypothetical protein ACJAXN_000077 [Psychromonas sp.]|jgi:hypothetical protein
MICWCHQNELKVLLQMAKQKALRELAVLLQKTEYAYQIAVHADLVECQANLNKEGELSQINLLLLFPSYPLIFVLYKYRVIGEGSEEQAILLRLAAIYLLVTR